MKRAIVNNFLDGSKQEAIDILLLGNTFIGKIGERARALLNSSFLHCKYVLLFVSLRACSRAISKLSRKVLPRLCCCCRGVVASNVSVFTSCIGQVSAQNLRPSYLGQSDKWLLIYGRGKEKK